jgi:molybdate transport system substrate-binding protein
MRRRYVSLLCALLLAAPAYSKAAEALIAVAANFAPAAATLKQTFEAGSSHSVLLASGSTGKLYAQIVNGAPYDALLAADQVRPQRLEAESFGVPGSRFVYAIGRLAVWVPGSSDNDQRAIVEHLQSSRRIAIANPELAPYGYAALEALAMLGLTDSLRERLATGENAAQTYAMVASGAADAGLVAWSHLVERGNEPEAWLVPEDWHTPIQQEAVLLRHGADNPAAVAFLAFLKTEAAHLLIARQGYLNAP